MFVKRKKSEKTRLAEEQRTHLRIGLDAEVTVDSETNFYYGLSENISEGGLFISTFRTEELGSELDLTITLPGQSRPLQIRGRVQWLREHSPRNSEAPPGFGLRFLNPTPELLTQVRQFIQQREPTFYEE